MQLKRWESTRSEGRNDKGHKKPAMQRQIKKATQALRKKLKGNEKGKGNCLSLFCV
ncbi:MAG: hypothetical protein LH631_06615 [Alkalinema sp. CAN_BIN05]|nr:hypothetical protein [Alkalinema sp. CAN_BIN05]